MAGQDDITSEQPAILGSWRLESFVMQTENGWISPLGERPDGLITYTPDGAMSAQLVRTGQGMEAMSDHTAYFGSFSISADGRMVTHHVLCSTVAGMAGTDQPRDMQLDGDRLTLSADSTGGHAKLVWRRFDSPRD